MLVFNITLKKYIFISISIFFVIKFKISVNVCNMFTDKILEFFN